MSFGSASNVPLENEEIVDVVRVAVTMGSPSEMRRDVISIHQQALERCNRDTDYSQWAQHHYGLAEAFQATGLALPLSEQQPMIDKAIEHAKKCCEEESIVQLDSQSLLGGLYVDYPNVDEETKTRMQELAIQTFKALVEVYTERFQNLASETTSPNTGGADAESEEQVLVELLRNINRVAYCYLVRRTGKAEENVNLVVEYSITALGYGPVETSETLRPMRMKLHELAAAAFLFKSQHDYIPKNRTKFQEESIKHHRQVLKYLGPSNRDETWAHHQLHLGVLYSEREEGEVRMNLELALVALRKSLQVLSPGDFHTDDKWLQAHMLIGDVYEWRESGDRFANLEEAKEHLQTAMYHLQEFKCVAGFEMSIDLMAKMGRLVANGAYVKDERLTSISAALHVYTKYLGLFPERPDEKRTCGQVFGEVAMLTLERAALPDAECIISGARDPMQDVNEERSYPRDEDLKKAHAVSLYSHIGCVCRMDTADAFARTAMVGREYAKDHTEAEVETFVGADGVNMWGAYSRALEAYNDEVVVEGRHSCEIADCVRSFKSRQQRKEYSLFQNKLYVDYSIAMFEHNFPDEQPGTVETAIMMLQRAALFFTKKAYPRIFAEIHMYLAMLFLQRSKDRLRVNVELSHRSFDKCVEVRGGDGGMPANWECDNMAIGAVNRREAAAVAAAAEVNEGERRENKKTTTFQVPGRF